MCGRFTFILPSRKKLQDQFAVTAIPENLASRYNAAPSQNLPVITNEQPKNIVLYRWGLVPHWAKDIKIGYKMINARAETITEKPSFKNAFKKRRCLVLADGFYEWQKNKDGKIPHRIMLKDKSPFGFAGLWESWKDDQGKELRSFTIITTESNALVKNFHDRMPVILSPEQKNDWLDFDLQQEKLIKMLKPYPENKMTAYPVSSLVNSPKNDVPEVIQEIQF